MSTCHWLDLENLDLDQQCSRLNPSYEFHFEELSNLSPLVERLVQIQYVNPRIKK